MSFLVGKFRVHPLKSDRKDQQEYNDQDNSKESVVGEEVCTFGNSNLASRALKTEDSDFVRNRENLQEWKSGSLKFS